MSPFEIFFSIPYFCSLQRNVLQSAGLSGGTSAQCMSI